MSAKAACSHLGEVKTVKHEKRHDEECVKLGARWVPLRT